MATRKSSLQHQLESLGIVNTYFTEQHRQPFGSSIHSLRDDSPSVPAMVAFSTPVSDEANQNKVIHVFDQTVSKFVLDHRNSLSMFFCEKIIQKSRLKQGM